MHSIVLSLQLFPNPTCRPFLPIYIGKQQDENDGDYRQGVGTGNQGTERSDSDDGYNAGSGPMFRERLYR